MLYIVRENNLHSPYFAVSALLRRCSYYADSADLALQNFLNSNNHYDDYLDDFEQQVLSSPAYTIIATYSPEEYPEYFI